MQTSNASTNWHSTACILCSINCGIEVQLDGRHLAKIRGDEKHPVSQGYLCQKAARLDYYQNHEARLTEPLRRRPDGSFETVSWTTAIGEIASRLASIRDTHGGGALAYYGGGGQGNHLGGVYGASLRSALGTRYLYSALAQEKTGDFWVNGKLFGRQTCHVSEDIEHADLVLLIGTNPWQAHGIPRAREVVRELGRDPERTLIVVDPRRTETAELADVHLQLRPGTDAYLLAALLGTIVQEGLENRPFLERRTRGFEALRPHLLAVPVDRYARVAGLDPEAVRDVARRLAAAKSASIRADLGLQQTLHSTLNSYLEKLLALLTGQFGRPGTNGFHTFFLPLVGHSDEGEGLLRTAVTGTAEIGRLFPPNVLPAEIDTDHPGRLRGLFVDSANPMISGADTQAYRRAFEKLELLVVVDVAMTETAKMAHYVLPACSQFEKWEATFFNLGFPTNHFHLRAPLLEPLGNTLPEPEIYRRLLVALGEIPDSFPALAAVARLDRRLPRLRLFPLALKAALALNPRWQKHVPLVLHETLGAALPGGARAAAVLWGAAQRYAERYGTEVRRAGIEDRGAGLGEALFERILQGRSGTALSTHAEDAAWSFIRHPDGRVQLDISELLETLAGLPQEAGKASAVDREYPFVLVAGERRSYNANTIYRDPRWRKTDADGALRIHPKDAAEAGLEDGAEALCESARGRVSVRVKVDDTVTPGLVTLPHGYGLDRPGDGAPVGPLVNLLTASEHCDPIAKTPFHKHVRVRLQPVPAGAA
jgi:anaerobic selenocysteine-containing dehydrogenase